jgi:hypothetical protein
MKKTLICAILMWSLWAVTAQQSIDWYKISGGGGTSTGEAYQVSGSIGQPDASVAMSGGNYSLTGGFWSFINVVQTAGAPTLYISHSHSTITVYWQDTATWTLQQNSNFATTNWTANTSWTTSNGTNSLIINNPSGNLFFRLKQ